MATAAQPLGLKEFIPLALTYFVGLVFLALFQNTILYYTGVLDTIFGKSLFLLVVHHLGFASFCALVLAFLFNFLEAKKPRLGLRWTKVMFLAFLIVESLLTSYYIQNYEALGIHMFTASALTSNIQFSIGMAILSVLLVLALCYGVQSWLSRSYGLISRMYPVTLILFSMFLATLASESREINKNKTQHLLSSISQKLFSGYNYQGTKEYPLLRPHAANASLTPFFAFKEVMPHVKLIVIEGLGSDFVGKDRPYVDFMPYLNHLQKKSLYWRHFLSNTGQGHTSIPTITGSLPFGKEGFTNSNTFLERNTLFSILRSNGYATGFAYGGNATLFGFDKFLAEEEVATVLDKNAFGALYEQQAEDRAGVSLGYPDAALYDRYQQVPQGMAPRLDVLLTLSTKAPYLIPEADRYQKKVAQIVAENNVPKKTKRFIDQHQDLFASYHYADDALKEFMAKEQKTEGYDNTIYIITGTHYSADMPQEDRLTRYKVPLIMYSPLLKQPGVFEEMASHMDLAPTLIALLDANYPFNVPQQVAWLGAPLETVPQPRNIPFLRGPDQLLEFMNGNHFITEGDVYHVNETLNLEPASNTLKIEDTEKALAQFTTINAYVTQENKILPKDISLVRSNHPKFTKEDMVWIHSVFNGDNFDNAYTTAHRLAMNKDWERAKLLCRYILNEIPRHADTEILLGRLHGWQKNYGTSTAILENVVQKYPRYADAYNALMDSYHWAGQYDKVEAVRIMAQRHAIQDELLQGKFEQAQVMLKEQHLKEAAQRTNNVSFQKIGEQ